MKKLVNIDYHPHMFNASLLEAIYGDCPTCHETMQANRGINYCCKCGEHLDTNVDNPSEEEIRKIHKDKLNVEDIFYTSR